MKALYSPFHVVCAHRTRRPCPLIGQGILTPYPLHEPPAVLNCQTLNGPLAADQDSGGVAHLRSPMTLRAVVSLHAV